MRPHGTVLIVTASLGAFGAGCTSTPGNSASERPAPGGGQGPGDAGPDVPAMPFEPGGVLTTYEARIGPITIPPGVEETRCIHVRLSNPEGVFVRRFRTSLGDGSHHFVVYRSPEPEERPEPAPCAGFSGFDSGEHAIFIAQRGRAELVFPSDGRAPVGLEIAPQQMLRLEMHYLNPTAEPLEITGVASVDTVPLSTDVIPSDLAFWGTTRLNAGGDPPSDEIPPQSDGDTGVMFQAALAGTKSFALTTHQHFRGTRMRVWHARSATDTTTLVADATDWADPPLEIFDPPLDFPANGAEESSAWGLAYRCAWRNTSPYAVGYGESADTNEMCFLWHYYYPAMGAHLCVDGTCCPVEQGAAAPAAMSEPRAAPASGLFPALPPPREASCITRDPAAP